jgi:L-histidine N-alpha-methyltransferase
MEILNCSSDTFDKDLKRDVSAGLSQKNKSLPSRYFYDDRGSELFEQICSLPEYYLTRTELSILRQKGEEITATFRGGDLVELGAGGSLKVRTLLESFYRSDRTDIRYVPVDVDESALVGAARELQTDYPDLKIFGIVGDITRDLTKIPSAKQQLFTFFGSTIGNFTQSQSREFFQSVARLMGSGDRFIVGVDLMKPRAVLERAYNDARGITSRFNKNILAVINRELDGNFNLDHFDHLAFFNEAELQIESYLRANRRISVTINRLDMRFEMEDGETIHTEISRKFTRERVARMVTGTGLTINRLFTDPKDWFALIELIPEM